MRRLEGWKLALAALAAGVVATPAAALPQDRRLPPASGSRQVALVVGNDAYPGTPLRNAVNDARAVGAALREVGYEVDLVLDADLAGLERAVNAFIGKLHPGDIGLLYYAGHGGSARRRRC